ncbi:MAG: hypothetical protein Q9226_008706, partial [Calogaya cf. arnoldii]
LGTRSMSAPNGKHHTTSSSSSNGFQEPLHQAQSSASEKVQEESDGIDPNGNHETDIRKKQVRSLDLNKLTMVLSRPLADFQGSVPILVRSRKTPSSFRPLTTSRLAYQSIGVIYGDIGTSPLYVYSSTFTSDPSYDDLLGALSLIIWSVTLMVSVKYVLIVLRADDEGEGGTQTLYAVIQGKKDRSRWNGSRPRAYLRQASTRDRSLKEVQS